jgi:ketosteroid isomerase-like protein
MTSVESRLQRLEDLDSIRTLTATYAHAVDKGVNGKQVDFEKLFTIFAVDARWTSAAMHVDKKGRDEIIKMLEQSTAAVPFAMHSFTNPVIVVNGDHASATWLLWVAINGEDGANQVYQSEDLTYVRSPGGWLIQSIDLHFGQMLK